MDNKTFRFIITGDLVIDVPNAGDQETAREWLEYWMNYNSPVRNWAIYEDGEQTEEEADKVIYLCDECMNEFSTDDLRPYKYEPSRKVCEDCHDQLMDA